MAEALKKKKDLRDGHRAIVRKRMREADALLEELKDKGTIDMTKLAQAKLTLSEKMETLRRLDDSILDVTDGSEEIAKEIEEADDFNHEVYARLVRVEKALSNSKVDLATESTTSAAGHAKLPKLNLPTFNGDLTLWMTFWDSYETAVHKNSSLSDVERFTYLRTLVTHTAKEAIAGFALTSANYVDAIQVLKVRFGNKDRIISKHMEALLAIESVRDNDVAALRALYDKVEAHTRELKALGLAAETYDYLLPPVLKRKLPNDLCLIISRKIPEDEWRLEKIMGEIGEELRARERSAGEQRKTNEKGNEKGFRRAKFSEQPKSGHPTGAALLSVTSSCCYCGESHQAEDCQKMIRADYRKQALREAGRCFICLKRGHLSRACRSRDRCAKCGAKHHTSICLKGENNKGETKPQSTSLNPGATPFKATNLFSDTNGNGSVLLQTAQTSAYNPLDCRQEAVVRVIFDSGSQRSYITDRVRGKLGLQTLGKRHLAIATFGACDSKQRECEVVRVVLRVREGEDVEVTLLTVPLICEPVRSGSPQSCLSEESYLQPADLADSVKEGELVTLDILIGLDHYWDLVTGETMHGRNGPTAVHSKLGWMLCGPVEDQTATFCTHVLTVSGKAGSEKSGLEAQLRKFWELEAFGIEDNESTLYDQFKENVKFDGNRYEVALPWRDTVLTLPDNYQLSVRRLGGLLRRLRQQPELLKEYDAAIRDQQRGGIVEVVEDPTQMDGDKVHYLPHHAVIRRDKRTTKLRVVYDASARSIGPSLNDCLHIGPKFNQCVIELLVRFRLHKCAFIADIEKAFLMIQVDKQDRDVLRFLWVKDIEKDPPELQVLRFTRVTFGVASSPFLLNATLRNHAEQFLQSDPELVSKLLRSLYVDDIISGTNSVEESNQCFKEFKVILAKGGFNLRKFVCSAKVKEDGENHEREVHKVLGIPWDAITDNMIVDLSEIVVDANIEHATKRHVLSIASKAYDPLGFASPVTIRLKILFQRLHCIKVGWDEVITSEEFIAEWGDLVQGLKKSCPIVIPRCYFRVEAGSWQLCGFCDASRKAYAAVVYLRCSNEDERKVSLVASKTRVSPLKEQTIPRLELLGALLLARLMATVASALRSEVELLEPECYTDSQIALCWIRGAGRNWKPFIENRVKEIRELVPVRSWKHCPGKENPADLPSRGITPNDLANSGIWIAGPSWLKDLTLSEEDEEEPAGEILDECWKELRVSDKRECGLLLIRESELSNCIDIERFSSFDQLIRVTAFVMKAVKVFKGGKEKAIEKDFIELQNKAEVLWVREAQVFLPDDRKFKEWEFQFKLFKDKLGLWRCGGRLKNADLPYSTKHPILLPTKHRLTQLIIRRAHERVFHNGVKDTLNEVRSSYWIIKGRSVVRSAIHYCALCRKLEGRAYRVPGPPPLPEFRVKEDPPFSYTGLDLAGPFFVKNGSLNAEGKVWICLYTCCVTRAIALDVLPCMSIDFFFRCFRRFVARHGLPRRVISDNAKTFKKAAKVFQGIMKQPGIGHHLGNARIQWTFNVERAPWWGGFFERLVRSVKRCLKKAIGRARLTSEELLTLIMEVEMILNSRPLSYITQEDLDEPLSPSHLLIGRRILSIPDNLCYSEDLDEDFEVTQPILSKRMIHLGRAIDQFWTRWKSEYLLELRDAHRINSKPSTGLTIKVGDIVVVHSDEKRRGFWNLGKIEELISGRDEEVRGAVVRVYTGQKKSKLLRRPLQRLYPIEVNESLPIINVQAEGQEAVEESCDNEPVRNTEDNVLPQLESQERLSNTGSRTEEEVRRPKRVAAIKARDKMLAQTMK